MAKNSKSKAAKIDALMEKASEALVATDYFETERLALEALRLAHAERDFERMSRIVLPLQEARRQKRLAAVDTGRLVRVRERLPEEQAIEPGVYLVEPMLVAADGRELRDRADTQRVPVLVVVREPETRLRQWPVVMIGPVTVRTRVEPPDDPEHPDIAWAQAAAEALGDEALEQMPSDLAPDERVEELLERLATVPEHERLHQALEAACKEAHAVQVSAKGGKPSG